METTLSSKQMEIVAHALGVDVGSAKRSKRKKDKKLPAEFYRNYFCASEGHSDYPTLLELQNAGLMMCTEPKATLGGSRYWYVVDAGIEVFTKEFAKVVN